MTTFDKLIIKLLQDTGLEVENLKRTYTGIHMKASGAFTWNSNLKGCSLEVGSAYSATELLKAKKLEKTNGFSILQYEIIPINK